MRSIRSGAWALLLLVTCAAQGGVNNWTARGPFGGPIYQLAIHPSQPDLAFAVAKLALYRTTDGGESWSQQLQLEPFFANYGPIRFDPAHPERIYAMARDSGLWRSTDGGDTFVNISPLALEGTNASGLAISADGNTIYYSTSGQQFFRSTDGGASFSERTAMTASGSRLVVDPANSLVVYAGQSNSLQKTVDGGDNWQELTLPSRSTDFAVTPGSPNILWANTPDGVYSKPDDGSSWSLALPEYAVHSDPAVPSILYASPIDGVGAVRRYSAGTWTDVDALPSVMNTVAISTSNTQAVLAGTDAGVFETLNGGTTWTRSDDGLDAHYVSELATGGGRVYASTGDGEIGIGDADEGILQRSLVEPDLTITSLGAHPTDPNVILVGSSSGVRYSNDGGASWHPGPANLASTRIDAIAFDPQSPQDIYLALSPQETAEAVIQRSTDGGATFVPVGGTGLNDVEATRLLIDPENSARMLLSSFKLDGNNNGVFRSVDGGVTWDRVLVNDRSFDIAIDPADASRMYALSHGTVNVSIEGGASFMPLVSFMDSRYGTPLSMALDPAMPDVLYVLSSGGVGYVVMRSVDAGLSWESMPQGPAFQWSPTKVAINAAAPTTVLVATNDKSVRSFEIAPDLAVSILDHERGTPNRFDVRVHNNGPLAATGITLDIQAPAGATDVSAELPGGTCTTTATTVHCSLPFLKLDVDATARVTYTSTSAAQLNVQANVTARERDPVGNNNTATATSTTPGAPGSSGGGGSVGGGSAGGGGGGGGTSLYFLLCLALLTLSAPPRRRSAR